MHSCMMSLTSTLDRRGWSTPSSGHLTSGVLR